MRVSNHSHIIIYSLILSLIALLSALSLDYLAWHNGKTSYFWGSLKKRGKPLSQAGQLSQIVFSQLSNLNLSSESVDQYRDQEGALHLLVDLTLKKYKVLESSLKKEFQKIKASIIKKEEKQTDNKNYYLWQVKGKKREKLIILFSCLKEKAAKQSEIQAKAKKKVALIIDDMGNSLWAINEVCSIKMPLTVSILPYSSLAKETAQIAHQNGLEVMLHLPLEPINSQEEDNGSKGMVDSKMNKKEVIQTVNNCVAQIPYVIGVNNHMGSKITASKIFMRIILEKLKEKNLFFIDSRTTADSVAYDVAQMMGVPSTYRNVFLDTEDTEQSIKNKLIELYQLAQKKGQALGICHPRPKTLKVLKENFQLFKKFKLEPVFASQLVH
ncbi:MAG: divergent polysaccharide deacetylase family protein [Candidatus Aminicenantales bacterium]